MNQKDLNQALDLPDPQPCQLCGELVVFTFDPKVFWVDQLKEVSRIKANPRMHYACWLTDDSGREFLTVPEQVEWALRVCTNIREAQEKRADGSIRPASWFAVLRLKTQTIPILRENGAEKQASARFNQLVAEVEALNEKSA